MYRGGIIIKNSSYVENEGVYYTTTNVFFDIDAKDEKEAKEKALKIADSIAPEFEKYTKPDSDININIIRPKRIKKPTQTYIRSNQTLCRGKARTILERDDLQGDIKDAFKRATRFVSAPVVPLVSAPVVHRWGKIKDAFKRATKFVSAPVVHRWSRIKDAFRKATQKDEKDEKGTKDEKGEK